MAANHCLVLHDVPAATQAKRVFERSLIAGLADTTDHASVGFNLRALKAAASAVRERLSQEQWHVIVQMEQDFFRRCELFAPGHDAHHDYSSIEALRALEATSSYLAAITGAQTDRMMRDDGWRLLSIGRHIERLATLSGALAYAFETKAVFDNSGFSAIVALFDSTITFHAQYQQRRDLPALLDLLVQDPDNPRSLSWVIKTMQGRLLKLAGNMSDMGDMGDIEANLASKLVLPDLTTSDMSGYDFAGEFERCQSAAFALSDAVSRRYFSHASSGSQSLGA